MMGQCRRTSLGFLKMQGQKLLTLFSSLFLGSGEKHAICLLSYNDNQKIKFSRGWQCRPLIVECVRLRFVDAALTLTFQIGQWACHWPFWPLCRPTHLLWKDKTMGPFHCGMSETKHHWRCVDAHSKHIKTAFVQSIIVCNKLHIHYWHPISHF